MNFTCWFWRSERGFGERGIRAVTKRSPLAMMIAMLPEGACSHRCRVRHDRDRQLLCIARHGAMVLQHEGAAATLQRSPDPLNRDVTSRSRVRAGGQHLTLTGPFEVALELFVDRHPTEGSALGFFLRLRVQLYFKCPHAAELS